MFEDLKKEKIVVEITNLVEKAEKTQQDIDSYCEFMKGVILVLKFLENRDEVLDLIRDLAECDVLKPFKVGVAGSYVNATNKKGSSIDIVLKFDSQKAN